jgi:hypothetical protein
LIDNSVPANEAISPLEDEAAPRRPFGLIDPTAAAATADEEP